MDREGGDGGGQESTRGGERERVRQREVMTTIRRGLGRGVSPSPRRAVPPPVSREQLPR